MVRRCEFSEFSYGYAFTEERMRASPDKLIRAAFIHRRLEPAEDRHALGVECAKLTVDICGLHLQGAKRLDGAPVAMRPIEACARQQRGLAAIDPGMHAVAVVLDLVQPAGACRRLVHQARELRLDPFRRPSGRSHGSN